MSDLRHRAAAAANEIAQLRDDAYLAGDHELAGELKQLDKLLGGRRGSVTLSAYESMRAGLEERLRQRDRSGVRGASRGRLRDPRRHLYAYLGKATRAEAEAALDKDRQELARDREEL